MILMRLFFGGDWTTFFWLAKFAKISAQPATKYKARKGAKAIADGYYMLQTTNLYVVALRMRTL